jgi:hypothetical protein
MVSADAVGQDSSRQWIRLAEHPDGMHRSGGRVLDYACLALEVRLAAAGATNAALERLAILAQVVPQPHEGGQRSRAERAGQPFRQPGHGRQMVRQQVRLSMCPLWRAVRPVLPVGTCFDSIFLGRH